MNRNDVLRLASEAGMTLVTNEWLERFAALVADSARGDYHEGWEEGYKAGVLAEREECAKRSPPCLPSREPPSAE